MSSCILVLWGLLFSSMSGAESVSRPTVATPESRAEQPATAPVVSSVRAAAANAGDDTMPADAGRNANLVTVIFTVTGQNGKLVRDLKQNQFTLLDNNRSPKEIVNFESQTNLPLRVGLLFDASNSIRQRFLFEQQASAQFLESALHPDSDRAFVLAFDEIPEVTQDFTADVNKLKAGIGAIRPGGGTALWDAVYYACREKMMKEKNSTPVRRVIIVLSDGDDNQSRVLRHEAIEMAQRAEVIIYTISTNLDNVHNSGGDHNLQALADATGGRAFYPYKLQDITGEFNDIQGELRSQYSISYEPDGFVSNGQFRSIQIIPENKKLKVRARKGYFAPKR